MRGITWLAENRLASQEGLYLVAILYEIFIQVTQMARPKDTADLKAQLIASQVAVSSVTYTHVNPVLNSGPSNLRTVSWPKNLA